MTPKKKPQVSKLYQAVTDNPFPSIVLLDLTDVCNLRCKMCQFWGETGIFTEQGSSEAPKPQHLEFELISDLVDEIAPNKTVYTLFGGEPLSYPHLERLIKKVKQSGSTLNMVTNGTLLKKSATLLVESGFDSIRISVDGPRSYNDQQRGKGSYARVMEGIAAIQSEKQRLASSSPTLGMTYVVTSENQGTIADFFLGDIDLSLFEIVAINMYGFLTQKNGDAFQTMLEEEWSIKGTGQWRSLVRDTAFFDDMDCVEIERQVSQVEQRAQELGVTLSTIPPTISAQNLRAYFRADLDAMEDELRFCPAPFSTVQITPQGKVLPCFGIRDFVLGDLQQNSFTDIWHGPNFEKMRKKMFFGLLPQCHSCCQLYLMGLWRKPMVDPQLWIK